MTLSKAERDFMDKIAERMEDNFRRTPITREELIIVNILLIYWLAFP